MNGYQFLSPYSGPQRAVIEEYIDLDQDFVLRKGAQADELPPEAKLIPASFGRYAALRYLAHGSFGIVYRAYDIRLRRLVALKFLKTTSLSSGELKDAVKRFRAEARQLGQVSHENIVAIYDASILRLENTEFPYVAIEFLPDGSLKDRMSRGIPWLTQAGGLDQRKVVAAFRKICLGVATVHDAGLIHRDLKPGNILFTSAGEPKVADFGLARRFHADGDATIGDDRTRTGIMLGTPAYMSPEQFDGDNEALTPASGVFALGIILYELITGSHPFKGDSPIAVKLRIIEKEPLAPRQLNTAVNADMETICLKCLRKEPEDRYSNARELADDLERFLNDEPIHARPFRWWEKLWRLARKNKRVAIPAAVAAFVVLAAAIIFPILWQSAEEAVGRENAANEKLRKKNRELSDKMYFEKVARAGRSWLNQDFADMERSLQECAADDRDWEWYFLQGQLGSRRVSIAAHQKVVGGLAYTPNGEILVTGSLDGNIKVWDSHTGKMKRSWPGHDRGVLDLVCLPDGKHIASGGNDSQLKVWDLEGNLQKSLPGHKASIAKVAASPDGKWVATAGLDKSIKVWNTQNWQMAWDTKLSGQAFTVAFLGNSRYVGASDGRNVFLWDVQSGKKWKTIDSGMVGITGFDLSSDSSMLAVGGGAGVKVMDLSGKLLHSMPIGQFAFHFRVAFSPDMHYVAASTTTLDLRIWDLKTGEELGNARDHPNGASGIAFHPKGKMLASSGAQGEVVIRPIVDTKTANVIQAHKSEITGFDAGGVPPRLATMAAGNECKIWDWQGKLQKTIDVGAKAPFWSLAWHPLGGRIAISSTKQGGWTKIWSLDTGKVEKELEINRPTLNESVWSQDGRYLAAGLNGNVVVWDAATGKHVQTIASAGNVHCICFAPNSKWLIAPDRNRKGLAVWDVGSWEMTGLLDRKGAVAPHDLMVIHPQNAIAATGSGPDVHLWDLGKRDYLKTLHGHQAVVGRLCFSPNGRRLASAGKDGTICVWSLSFDHPLVTIPINKEIVGIAFSPDSQRLVVATAAGALQFFDGRKN